MLSAKSSNFKAGNAENRLPVCKCIEAVATAQELAGHVVFTHKSIIHLMKKSGLTLLSLFVGSFLCAQVPSNPLGLNPTSLKWNQINTEKVQVIFPRGLEKEGQRVANIVHHLWDRTTETVGEKREKVSILLQNQTTISNGFVTVGPFRSEFYMAPPQFDVTTDWVDLLAIHEYRHVTQFANTSHGISKLVRRVLGSWAWGSMFGLALPRWFFEGDAVDMETRLTASGRGRMPNFNMEYRSLVLDNKYYNYEKASAGSLKDFVPDWYPLGYYMTTHARENFGEDIWAKVVKDAVRYKGLFFPFSRSLKSYTGLSTKELYTSTRSQMDSVWKDAPPVTQPAQPATQVNSKPKNTIISYNNPVMLRGGEVLVAKRGYDRITGYYLISADGTETKLTEPGILHDRELSTLSFRQNLLCWSELAFHPRWGNKNYANIKVYDLDTGIKRKITAKSRLFSPALSPDAKKIVAVHADELMKYQLVVLNAGDGSEILTVPNPEDQFYIHPNWTPDGESVIAILKRNELHSLQLIDPQTGTGRELTSWANIQLAHPFPFKDLVFFSAGYLPVNNIYVFDRNDGSIYQVTDSRLGAFQPSVSPDGRQILYSDFSAGGYNIKQIPFDRSKWKRVQFSKEPANYFKATLNENTSILQDLEERQFDVKKFNRFSGLFNPHSILPLLDPPIVGARILSDNKFSTLSAELGGFYNLNEEEWTVLGEVTYAELFPEINLDYRLANRSSTFFIFDQIGDTTLTTAAVSEEWTESDLGGGISIPLNLSQGNFFTNLELSANYHLIGTRSDNRIDGPAAARDTLDIPSPVFKPYQELVKPALRDEDLQALDLQFRFSTQKRRALQNLNPRLAAFLSARYRRLINSAPFQGENLLLRADLFFPGIRPNHSFYLTGAYQRSEFLDNYKFSNLFFYPRGYDSVVSDEVARIGINYSLPLWYPDVALGPLAFIKRVKANFFFDYATLQTGFPFTEFNFLNGEMRSVGVELRFDVRVVRIVDMDFGVRYSYLLDSDYAPGGQVNQFDFLLISIR